MFKLWARDTSLCACIIFFTDIVPSSQNPEHKLCWMTARGFVLKTRYRVAFYDGPPGSRGGPAIFWIVMQVIWLFTIQAFYASSKGPPSITGDEDSDPFERFLMELNRRNLMNLELAVLRLDCIKWGTYCRRCINCIKLTWRLWCWCIQ